MKWIKVDKYAVRSEPPGYWINLAVTGDTIAYTAVKSGEGQGPEILHVERGLPGPLDNSAHPDRVTGFRLCREACERDEEKMRRGQ